jgi:hypothetical protein
MEESYLLTLLPYTTTSLCAIHFEQSNLSKSLLNFLAKKNRVASQRKKNNFLHNNPSAIVSVSWCLQEIRKKHGFH